MSGYDVKLSGQAPYLPWAKIKGTYLYSNPSKTPPVNAGMSFSFSIILLRSIQASAPKSYYLDAKTGPYIRGNILGVDIELAPSERFEFGQENNNTMNAKSYGKLTVKLPLGNKSNNKCL
jgi:hypothetical protein